MLHKNQHSPAKYANATKQTPSCTGESLSPRRRGAPNATDPPREQGNRRRAVIRQRIPATRKAKYSLY
jgi:hypothetical protein